MSKLLVSCGTLCSGGAERVLSILSTPFAENYDEVIYLTWIDQPDFYTLDSRVQRICVERECNSKFLPKKALWFKNYVKKENPSLVLSFLEPFNVMICFTLMGVNVPVIVANRNDPRYVWGDFIHRNLRALAYRKAVGNLSQTENNKNYFKGELLEKGHVIFNPIFLPEEYVGKAINSEKKNRIVSVARISKQKNPEMLIRAFKKFHLKHPEFSLTMYGNGEDRDYVLDLINKEGLSSCIFLPGAKNNIWDEIADAKCFVMTSWYEGMPNALLEAMCLGLPCVSTKVSGAVDLIKNGENGILVDLDDDESFAEALSLVIDKEDYALSIGKKATEIYNLLEVKSISHQWIDYLNKMIAAYNH